MCGNPACRKEISDHGNSKRGGPPELDGDVCDTCNAEVVIPARLVTMELAVAEFKEKRSKDLEKRSKDSDDDGAAAAEITNKISDEDLDAIVEGLPASFGPKADLKVTFIIQISFHLVSQFLFFRNLLNRKLRVVFPSP